MEVPSGYQLEVSKAKVVDYLMNERHPDGRSKAKFFLAQGFVSENWNLLATILKEHYLTALSVHKERIIWGEVHIVEAPLHPKSGRMRLIRTVWVIENESQLVRLVTAYPIKRRGHDS